MKKSHKKIAILIMTAMISSSILIACKKENKTSDTTNINNSGFAGYPIKTDKSLKIWSDQNKLVQGVTAQDQSPFHVGLDKNTGVKLQWSWPAAGADAKQALNLLIASNDLPDILYTGWGGLAGGPDSYINDKVIISLNDSLKKYAPNLTKYLASNQVVDKQVKTDSGNYYVFPFVRGDQQLTVFRGPAVRKDWLEELNIKVPETISDWDSMLRTLKDKKGAVMSYPDGWANEIFVGAYGVPRTFYQENGKVKFGPAEKGYKDFLAQMNKWYKDGVLDKDFTTIDANGLKTKVLNDKVGAGITSGGTVADWNANLAKVSPTKVFVGVKNPSLNKGEKVKFSQMDNLYTGGGAAITTACKDIELAARVLDWGYSEEGRRYWNWGAEGESYTMVNGKPQLTDKVLKEPTGIPNGLDKYTGLQWAGVSISEAGWYEQKVGKDVMSAISTWADTDMAKNMLPPITPTTDESTAMNKYQTALDTYVKEMYFKFVIGSENLDKFDDYVVQLKKVGLDELIKMKQVQLDRYNKR